MNSKWHKMTTRTAALAFVCMALTSCTEDYSNGEKVGNLIEFTHKGIFWKS